MFCPNQRIIKHSNFRRNKLSLRPFHTEKDVKQQRALCSPGWMGRWKQTEAEGMKGEQSKWVFAGCLWQPPALRAPSLLYHHLPGPKELTALLGQRNRSRELVI